jgi:hypothetical protein
VLLCAWISAVGMALLVDPYLSFWPTALVSLLAAYVAADVAELALRRRP